MPVTEDLQDERLAELLEEALCELRSGRPLDTIGWHGRHPELGREGASLLATLVRFATSAEDWRAELPRPHRSPASGSRTAVEDSSLPEVIGRYLILSKVGIGAMGTVFQAHDPQLDRLVAVKVPRMDKPPHDREAFTERFLREARHAASVRHPHICPIYDAGQHDGQPYVVMAYVDGEPLDFRISRIGRFDDARQAVRLVIQVAQALAAVHSHQIIHRDLKPANILLDRSGQALLTDFGLAREIEDGKKLTVDGIVVGTPSYMSPEQATGQNSDLGPSADLYSLGIVLYEMLTGKLPFRGSVCEVLRKIVVELPASPLEHRPNLDPRLAELVLKAIAKHADDRFPSAGSFADALQTWLESASGSTIADLADHPAAAASPQTVAMQAVTVQTATQVARPGKRARRFSREKHLAASAIAASLFVAAAFGFYGWNHNRSSGGKAPIDTADTRKAPHARPKGPAPQPLKGNVEIMVWSDPASLARGIGTAKNGVPVSQADSGALPLQNGELVHLHATLNRPAYVYLIWIDSEGKTIPLYPWDADRSDALWEAPLLKDSAAPTKEVHCPQVSNQGFAAVGVPGMQHVVLLARTTPLESPARTLQSALKDLPASPLANSREVAYLEWSPSNGSHVMELRGIAPGKTKEFDAPVFNQLKDRLQKDFELIKVWRFAQID
jgi:tRNA A-37 threonylcarbamoyl transferase component Bud32